MLPQEHISWLVRQPEHVVSMEIGRAERFAFGYLAPTLDYKNVDLLMDAIRKDLNRSLGKMQPESFNDMKQSVDKKLGLDTAEWREIPLSDALQYIIFRSTSRAIVGEPLCLDEGYIQSLAGFATSLGMGAIVVGQYLPSMLKPFVGCLVAIPVECFKVKAFRYLLPVIKDRLDKLQKKKDDPSFDYQAPLNLITWMASAMLGDRSKKTCSPRTIACQILLTVSTC